MKEKSMEVALGRIMEEEKERGMEKEWEKYIRAYKRLELDAFSDFKTAEDYVGFYLDWYGCNALKEWCNRSAESVKNKQIENRITKILTELFCTVK